MEDWFVIVECHYEFEELEYESAQEMHELSTNDCYEKFNTIEFDEVKGEELLPIYTDQTRPSTEDVHWMFDIALHLICPTILLVPFG